MNPEASRESAKGERQAFATLLEVDGLPENWISSRRCGRLPTGMRAIVARPRGSARGLRGSDPVDPLGYGESAQRARRCTFDRGILLRATTATLGGTRDV
jgi:hypothetical protein